MSLCNPRSSNNLNAILIKKSFLSIKMIPLTHIKKSCISETRPISMVPAPRPLGNLIHTKNKYKVYDHRNDENFLLSSLLYSN